MDDKILNQLVRNSFLVDAIFDHYCKTMAEQINQPEEKIRKEIKDAAKEKHVAFKDSLHPPKPS